MAKDVIEDSAVNSKQDSNQRVATPLPSSLIVMMSIKLPKVMIIGFAQSLCQSSARFAEAAALVRILVQYNSTAMKND